MSDITIGDIPREKTVLDGSEWFEGQDGVGSFKSVINSIRGNGVRPVTTSAASQDVALFDQVVAITTGGTGGTELINVPFPPLPIDETYNLEKVGVKIFIVLQTQTNPSDVVKVTVGGADGPTLYLDPIYNSGTDRQNSILLNYEGASVCLVWVIDGWKIFNGITDGNFQGVTPPQNTSFHPAQDFTSGSHGKNNLVSGGTGDASGGNLILQGGGASDPENYGLVIIGNTVPLPTIDPAVFGALWLDTANGYVLKVSQG